MSVDWNNFFNKLPNTLSTLGAIASSFEQFSLTCDPNWRLWNDYNNYRGNPTSVFYSGLASMDNFTNAIIQGQSVDKASLFCDQKVQEQFSTTSNINNDTNENISELQITTDSEWLNLNKKYADLSTEDKETWTTKYKDGLNNLAKLFSKTIKGASSTSDEKITQEEFKNYVKNVLKELPEYKNLSETALEEAANKVWYNTNIGDDLEYLDSKEIAALLAALDDTESLDGKITKTEKQNGISSLAKEGSDKVKTQYNKFFKA